MVSQLPTMSSRDAETTIEGRSLVSSSATAVGATFVNPPKDKKHGAGPNASEFRNLPGVFLAQTGVAVPIRFLIASTVLMLAGSTVTADTCAAQDPIALARTGTTALEHQRFGDALEAFTKAAALEPGDASLCFGAGVAAFMLGQNDVAQTRFERALALNPHHLEAAVWLGDLHYRAGHIQEAISVYEAARLRSPGASELQEQLAVWRREQELQSRFHAIRTEHFTALFEAATDEPLAREVVELLEAAYWRVGNTLGVFPLKPITTVLY